MHVFFAVFVWMTDPDPDACATCASQRREVCLSRIAMAISTVLVSSVYEEKCNLPEPHQISIFLTLFNIVLF